MASLNRSLRNNVRPETLFVNISLILISLACLLPVVWTVSASLKTRDELYMATPALIPREPTLANYTWMLSQADMSRLPLNLWNSVKVTVGAVVIQCITATMAGFAFARLDFRGRDLIFYLLILMMFIPRAGGLMALYELMSTLHLRNSHLGLMLLFPSAISVALFVMRQNFLGIPRELEEAATMDGANTWQLFWWVDAPMVKGGIAVVAIWEFIYVWGEYLVTLTLIDFPELETVSIAVTKLQGWGAHFTSSILAGYGAEAAAYVVAMAPVILVFILLQKWFVRGLSEGILKL
ncbi:MAG TPA: carbohydrate ABC transporter permease [Caldilineaceae bacterium]|nr:carbohydrate ABC transporter permease [Caldilineaceae bacterium]